jgi:hypothetical protein
MAKKINNIFKAPSINVGAPKKVNTTNMIVSGWAFSKAYLDKKCAVLTPWQLAQLFSDPRFCVEVQNCLSQEIIQDLIWDSIQWYDYNDALNTWLQENPFIGASSITYNNTVSWLSATNVQDAIDEINSLVWTLVYYELGTDGWLSYTDELWVVSNIKLSHTETIGHTANTPYTITHWLGSTRINVTAYDVASWEEVRVEVLNRTTNTVDIVSTTSDNLEIIIRK